MILLPRLRRTICLVVLALIAFISVLPVRAQEPAATAMKLYLPQLTKPTAPNVFGLEVTQLYPGYGLDLLLSTGTTWVRRNGLFWKEIEPVEGKGYVWDTPYIARLDREAINASEAGLNLILIVRASPSWATAPYTADCAPVNPQKISAFTHFLEAAVRRYSAPPYNVKHWEIGNEPDAYIFPTNAPFGCWGVESDPYYGGEAYGRFLREAYKTIKRVDPTAKVLNGGLLLYKPYNPADPDTKAGRFFEGMLRAGAGDSFDIVSFHSYIYFQADPHAPLGPREDWRVEYLRGLMRQYQVPEKPMIRTETALLCPFVTSECRWAQASVATRTYVRAMRERLLGNIWYLYNHDGYHNTAMIEPSETFIPRPSYFAYRQVAMLLAGATYIGPTPGQPATVEGYRFEGDGVIDVLWTDEPEGVIVGVPVPKSAKPRCFDRDGGPISCQNQNGYVVIRVGASPVYVQAPDS